MAAASGRTLTTWAHDAHRPHVGGDRATRRTVSASRDRERVSRRVGRRHPRLDGGTASWVPRDERFYRSDNIHFSPANVPAELAPLLSPDSRRELRLALEDHFRHKFQPRLQVSANRYRPGQGTLIHTDFVASHLERDRFFFTHRFLVYFLRGWDTGRGGALGLFSSTEPASLAKTIEPIHNRGVGLVIGPRSYHAVAAVNNGERYTVNICLRSVTGEYETVSPSPWH